MLMILAGVMLSVGITGCSVNEEDIYGSFPYLEVGVTDTVLSNVASKGEISYWSNRSVKVKVIEWQGNWITANVTSDKIAFEYTDNDLENPRSATIEVYTPNYLVLKKITVTQEASGELTYYGDLILHDRNEIAENSNTVITGNLIIGNVDKADLKPALSESGIHDLPSVASDISDSDIQIVTRKVRDIQSRGLAVTNTEATAFPLDIIRNCRIERLGFGHNRMSELPSAEVMSGMELTELSINDNPVTDISALSACSKLSYLDISGTGVYDLNPLLDLKELKTLRLDRLPMTQQQLEVFSEYLSHVDMSWDNLDSDACPAPVVEAVEVLPVSDTEVKLTARVSGNAEGVKKVGFYVGLKRDFKEMSFHEGTYSDGVMTKILTVDDLAGTIHFVRACAENEKGTGFSSYSHFGSVTYDGNIYLKSYDDLSDFREKYSHVNGSVLVGDISSTGSGIKLQSGGFNHVFKPSDMSDLSHLSALVYVRDGLYIGNASLANVRQIAHIRGIRTLWLKANQIVSLPELECSETVSELDVSMNFLTGFDFLERFPALTRLCLGADDAPDSETNEIGVLDGLEKYSNLRYLDLSGLPVHQWQVDELCSKMPKTEIVFTPGKRTPYIPTVSTLRAVVDKDKAVLRGEVTKNGKAAVKEYGFYHGKTPDSMTKIKVGETLADGTQFSYTVPADEEERYCFRAYAVNQFGESLSDMETYGIARVDLSAQGTANCYIVPGGGNYRFDATVKGNSNESVGTPVSVALLWTNRFDGASGLVSSFELKNGHVEFSIDETDASGNALFAVKDASGNILWSWHIWVCNFDPEMTMTKYSNGAVMMDRNIGATKTVSLGQDNSSYGLYYQWGRKDPFVLRSPTEPKNAIKTYPYDPKYDSIEYSVAHPTEICDDVIWHYDVSLWGRDKTMFDPCPPGWRVPDFEVWADWQNDLPQGNVKGYRIIPKPYSTPRTYYPMGGSADGVLSSFDGFGTDGFYWTSDYEVVMNMYYMSGCYIYGYMVDRRASVRCMKE